MITLAMIIDAVWGSALKVINAPIRVLINLSLFIIQPLSKIKSYVKITNHWRKSRIIENKSVSRPSAGERAGPAEGGERAEAEQDFLAGKILRV